MTFRTILIKMGDEMGDAPIDLPPDSRPARPRKPRGRHPQRRLTAVHVRQERRPGRYRDGGGLMLYIDAAGAKRWVLRVVAKGRRVDVGLGSALVVPLVEAREEALRLRRIARSGGDPLTERRKMRHAVPTFREAATVVHQQLAPTFKNVKHRAQWLTSLQTYVVPTLGDRPVDSISTADVLKVLSAIWTVKPETAKRTRQRIAVVLDWAKAAGHRQGDNPCQAIGKVLPKIRQSGLHHAAMAYADVPTFMRELRAADASLSVRLALEFTVLTASRTGEVLGARWNEIDRDAALWIVPAARMKAHREHQVPLSPRVLEIITAAAAISDGSGVVFPGRPARPLSNMAMAMLLRRLGRPETVHGFRSSFRDWAAERSRAPRAVVEHALAHQLPDRVEAAYQRSSLLELRRELMGSWAAFITNAPATVLPFVAEGA